MPGGCPPAILRDIEEKDHCYTGLRAWAPAHQVTPPSLRRSRFLISRTRGERQSFSGQTNRIFYLLLLLRRKCLLPESVLPRIQQCSPVILFLNFPCKDHVILRIGANICSRDQLCGVLVACAVVQALLSSLCTASFGRFQRLFCGIRISRCNSVVTRCADHNACSFSGKF